MVPVVAAAVDCSGHAAGVVDLLQAVPRGRGPAAAATEDAAMSAAVAQAARAVRIGVSITGAADRPARGRRSQGPPAVIPGTFGTRPEQAPAANCQQVLREMILMHETGHMQASRRPSHAGPPSTWSTPSVLLRNRPASRSGTPRRLLSSLQRWFSGNRHRPGTARLRGDMSGSHSPCTALPPGASPEWGLRK